MNSFANIEDYLLFRGDLSFGERPFNLIDNLVFNELAYVDYSSLDWTCPQPAALVERGEEILQNGKYRLKNLYGGQQNFFELAIRSRRFGSLAVRDYQELFSDQGETQFAAITFDLDDHTSYIAFRGTDDSITGWKEDFMIAFTRTGSQKLAAAYLNRIMQDGRQYYVGGHSKGGNLALYAAGELDESRRKQILHIFDNDGPCFAEDVFDVDKITALDPLVTRIIPEFCLIGKIYEIRFSDTHIVLSANRGVNSHDLISWGVQGISLLETDRNDPKSERLIHILMEWAHAASIEERRIFVDELFDAFRAGGAESVNDITGRGFLKVLKAMSETSPTARRIGESLVKYAIGLD